MSLTYPTIHRFILQFSIQPYFTPFFLTDSLLYSTVPYYTFLPPFYPSSLHSTLVYCILHFCVSTLAYCPQFALLCSQFTLLYPHSTLLFYPILRYSHCIPTLLCHPLDPILPHSTLILPIFVPTLSSCPPLYPTVPHFNLPPPHFTLLPPTLPYCLTLFPTIPHFTLLSHTLPTVPHFTLQPSILSPPMSPTTVTQSKVPFYTLMPPTAPLYLIVL